MNHGEKRKRKRDSELFKFVVSATANAVGTLLADAIIRMIQK